MKNDMKQRKTNQSTISQQIALNFHENGFLGIGRASERDKKKSANRMTFIQLALQLLVTPEGF